MTWLAAVQIVVAAGLGAVIGLEREVSGQPAGLRTHMLVALGATLFTLAGMQIGAADPTRIAAQVVTGIGFLGGGAIVREGATTKGLTTAASLWVTAAVGLAVGLAAWLAAVLTTVLALVVLYSIRRMEQKLEPRRQAVEATLTLAATAAIDEVADHLLHTMPASRVLRVSCSDSGQRLVLRMRTSGESLAALAADLRSTQGVVGVEITT